MAASSGFFSTNKIKLGSIAQVSKPARKSIDVGGTGDCGFRSLAAGIVDNILSNKSRANQELISVLFERHFKYFPQPQPVGRLLTPAERLEQIVRNPFDMAKFIVALAYTLRQIAVDEMVAHPEHYRGAFADINEQTAPAQMRLESTWIDESAIAAVSVALNLPIEVQVVAKNKELPMRLHYDNNSTIDKPAPSAVVMQLQHGHYLPQVNHPERFATVKTLQATAVKPMIASDKTDPELSEILAKIDAEDKRLLAKFEEISHRLTAMVAANEVSKEDLLAIYVKGMKKSDYLQGRVKHVGIEHGNQRFFEALENSRQGVKLITLPKENHDEQITKELVHAIARAISIGQLDSAAVFAQIDHDEERKVSLMEV